MCNVLDNDCVYNILIYLEAFDIIKCSLINKQFYDVHKSELLWKKLFKNTFCHIECDNNFYANYIKQIKINIGIYKTKTETYLEDSITCLDMGYQKIGYVSRQIENLVNLSLLYLRSNELQTIPIYIFKLSNLKILSLSNNKLKYIPPEIKKLSQLCNLFLDNNELISLPTEIGDLKNLRYLMIHNNKIRNLPKEMDNLKNLRSFCVDSELKGSISNEFLKFKYLEISYVKR